VLIFSPGSCAWTRAAGLGIRWRLGLGGGAGSISGAGSVPGFGAHGHGYVLSNLRLAVVLSFRQELPSRECCLSKTDDVSSAFQPPTYLRPHCSKRQRPTPPKLHSLNSGPRLSAMRFLQRNAFAASRS
jgi:hypothetical protein